LAVAPLLPFKDLKSHFVFQPQSQFLVTSQRQLRIINVPAWKTLPTTQHKKKGSRF